MPSGTYSIKWDNHWTLKLLEAIQGNDAWNRSLFGKSIVKTNDIWKATRDICLVLFGKDEAWYTFMHGKGFVGRNDQGDVMPTGQWGSKYKDPVRTKLENLNRAVTSKSLKRKHGFSKRWKQWSDIPDSVQRNKLRAACPYYFILHELHDGKPAYIPPAPVPPPPAVPPSARRPNKRPRQLATPGDSSEDEDAPRVIRGRKSSPIVVNDTSDSESDETESASAIDKDDGSAILVPIKPVVRQAQMLVPSASSAHTTVKLSQSAGTAHGTCRTAKSLQLPAAANRKVQQEEFHTDSAINGGQDSDSGEEDASSGSEADEPGSESDENADRHESNDPGDGARPVVSTTPPASTIPENRKIRLWLQAARRPSKHKQWRGVGRNSKDEAGAPESISTEEKLLRIRTMRLRKYLRAFIALRDRGLALMGPPMVISVAVDVKNQQWTGQESLSTLLKQFAMFHPDEQPTDLLTLKFMTTSATKVKPLRFCLDSFAADTKVGSIAQGPVPIKLSAFALLEDYDRLYQGLPGDVFDRGKYRFERPSE